MEDQLQFDHDVFISYSSHDKEWVRTDLLEGIEGAGLRAFIDFRDFKRGAPSIKEMERGVTTSRKTLLVLTPDYIESAWCEIENIMLQTLDPANRNLRLIPLLRLNCNKPLRISTLTHVDFTEGANLELGWHQLLGALNAEPARVAEQAIPLEVQAEIDTAKDLTDNDKFSEALPILEKALVAADAAGHTIARVKVRVRLANALFEAREDFVGAERHLRDASVLVPVDNLDLKHNVLHGLGDMLLFSRRLDESKATIHTGLNIAKLSGKVDHIAQSLISLSLLERAVGFHDRAVAKLDEAVQLLLQRALSLPEDQKKRNAQMLAVCYINHALLCRDAGKLDEALTWYSNAHEQHLISGDKLDVGKALLFCGEVHCTNASWEEGFDCFREALETFKEVSNPLWGSRALEHISRLLATHERWDEAVQAMLGAAAGADEARNPGEQVHFLCLSAKLLREWKTKTGRDNVAALVHKLAKNIPKENEPELMSTLSAKMREMSDAIDKGVRHDEQVRDLLNQAKVIAEREHLHQHLANCLLDEAHNATALDEIEVKHKLIARAVDLLKRELRAAQFPNRRGHLMGRISALYVEIGEPGEALSWLKKAGEVFEKSGDAFGLANFYGSLAEMHRAEGRLDDEIQAYRQVLSTIEGRSFHHVAAGTRINLAAALRYRREFGEAQRLLNEAEVFCERHHFKDFISAIARNRSDIEKELEASQAPAHTLTELLDSLHQLVKYRPEYATAYLPFWYFAWNSELLSLLRSGPHLSLMVVTDNVKRFMEFSDKFRHFGDHFLMATSHAPTVEVEASILPIPPSWLFPATFRFLMMRRDTPQPGTAEQELTQAEDDGPPTLHFEGPATMLPPYTMIDAKSDVEGEGQMMALHSPRVPQEAIDLMIRWPTEELIQNRAVWLPTDRFSSKDPFLGDLRIAHQRCVFPVYFERLPTSDAVAVCGAARVTIPAKLLNTLQPSLAAKWKRALLKLTKLSKEDAQTLLLDLPEIFADAPEEIQSLQIEIHLFEFNDIGERSVFYPALLVRDPPPVGNLTR